MATHTNLPIYKVAYDLLDAVTDFARSMPRDFKQSIGGKISAECIEIMVLVFRANVARDKEPHLLDLLERLQVAELLIRLAKDKRLISQGAYAKAVELTTSIGKQANGWRRAAHRIAKGPAACGRSRLSAGLGAGGRRVSEQTLLEQAAEVRERRAALGRTVQELKQLKGDWTQFELAASDAMRIADDGLRNAWQMLDRLNQFGKAEIGKLAAPNAEITGG